MPNYSLILEQGWEQYAARALQDSYIGTERATNILNKSKSHQMLH